jgi:hypothetical protein
MRVRMQPIWQPDRESYAFAFQRLNDNLEPTADETTVVTPMHRVSSIHQTWAETGMHAAQLGFQPVWTNTHSYPLK